MIVSPHKVKDVYYTHSQTKNCCHIKLYTQEKILKCEQDCCGSVLRSLNKQNTHRTFYTFEN